MPSLAATALEEVCVSVGPVWLLFALSPFLVLLLEFVVLFSVSFTGTIQFSMGGNNFFPDFLHPLVLYDQHCLTVNEH